MVPLKLRYLIIIGVCLHSRHSQGLPYEAPYTGGIEVVTYGEPCHRPRRLPIRIEEPVPFAEECVLAKFYRPLKLYYQISKSLPRWEHSYVKYPVAVEVPEVPTPLELCAFDPLRGKAYGYRIQTPLPPPPPVSIRRYSYDFQVLPPHPRLTIPDRPVKLLTGLTSRIDRVLVPACERLPSCSCKATRTV